MRLHMRRCVNYSRWGGKESASRSAAIAARAEDLEEVAVDLEVVLTGQGVGQVTDGTGAEWNGGATPRADEMMAVNRRSGHVDRAS